MQPLLLLYSETNADNISSRIGKSEYSYYFVLKWFAPALATLGEIKIIHDPLTEADHAYDLAAQQGRPCVLFSFAPPHRTLMPQRCPIVPLVAWEFDRIPDYSWDGQPETDWRYNLKRAGCAITHSQFARRAILNAMGEDFPVWSIPAPVWDRFHARGLQYHGEQGRTPARGINLHVKGMLYDSTEHIPSDPGEGLRQARLDMAHPAPVQVTKWQRRAARWQKRLHKVTRLFKADEASNTAPAQASPPPLHHLHAKGVVYASILNPSDARKNWCDIVTGFVSAFQNVEDAVLVLKLNELDSTNTFIHMTFMLKKFMWMKCKIYIFNGYLEDHDYDQFLDGIDYVVNFSTGEGQCLPLMELMSMGVPAISPDHTSMADYVTPENAYILPSFKTLSSWPHDSRLAFSTLSCQVSWEALRNAYTESYQRAKQQPSAYQAMSRAAMQHLETHCSLKVATTALQHVITSPAVRPPSLEQTSRHHT